MTKYRPRDQIEGEMFMSQFCDNCSKVADCVIPLNAMLINIGSARYPKAWKVEDGKPVCSEFQGIQENGQSI